MKLLNLMLVIFLVPFFKISSFDHIVELKAIKSLLETKINAFSTKHDTHIGREILCLLDIIEKNNNKDEQDYDINNYFENEIVKITSASDFDRIKQIAREKNNKINELQKQATSQKVNEEIRNFIINQHQNGQDIINLSKLFNERVSIENSEEPMFTVFNADIRGLNSLENKSSGELPSNPKSNNQWLKSGLLAALSGCAYGFSKTKIAQHDPKIALTSKIISGVSLLSAFYSAFNK